MFISINELEKDVLREMLNISLAKAADTFAGVTNGLVLLDVPDVNFIEPEGIKHLMSEYTDNYTAMHTSFNGDIIGSTFLLFSGENVTRFCEAYKSCKNVGNGHLSADEEELLLETSHMVTDSMVKQLSELLKLEVKVHEAKALYTNKRQPINIIIHDMHLSQPMLVTIKTQFNFNRIWQTVELPLLVFFNADSIQKLLRVMRNNNLYDFKLLRVKRKSTSFPFQKG